LYGITPPKAQTPAERVSEIAARTLNNLCSLDIDALVVYDVQDESARTTEERPFPFASALDPFEYASQHLQSLTVPKIIYRPAGKFSKEELSAWLQDLKTHKFHPVFVGLPSPDYVVKTSLKEAYEIWREYHEDHSVIGAVTIPERHAILNDEEVRILDKVDSGVSYFISQCIFNVEYTKKILDDLVVACDKKEQKIPTIIFTLTVCGSAKTLQFMEWLGIHIPEDIKEELKASTNAVTRSVEIGVAIAKDLIQYCQERSIPFGFNIESVAIRKEEIEASLELINTVGQLLKINGLRTEVKKHAHQLVDEA
jgi:5,10-methylenetetrahydrofolate reductase